MGLTNIRFALLIIAIGVGPTFATGHGNDGSTQDKEARTRLAKAIETRFQVAPTIYLGLPCLVEISATGVAPLPTPPNEMQAPEGELELPLAVREEWQRQLNLTRRLFPAFTPFSTHALPLSVAIKDRNDNEVVSHEKPSKTAFETGPVEYHTDGRRIVAHPKRPMVLVSAGETKSWFFDFSGWLSELAPGDYSVSIRLYSSPEQWWETPTQHVTVKALDSAEWKVIRTVVPAKQTGHNTVLNWLDPTINIEILHSVLPAGACGSLAFHLLLGKLQDGVNNDEIPSRIMNSIPMLIRPLVDIAQYEMHLRSGDERQAKELYDRISQNHPNLAWLMDRAMGGDGLIAQVDIQDSHR